MRLILSAVAALFILGTISWVAHNPQVASSDVHVWVHGLSSFLSDLFTGKQQK